MSNMQKHIVSEEQMKKMYRPFRFLLIILLFALFAGVSRPAYAVTSVFFNEIHYDNTGTDTGEAIEIAGPAGTDLTGWSIVLYNGANGLVYDTDVLSGVIPNQANGFGTLFISYPTNGIQNGAPDGMALIDPGDNIIQFLSYEGTFTAVDGLAAGMTSTDISVSQSGSGAVGNSLQLAGSGTVYEDFTWEPEAPNTFGAVNTGQSFGGTPTPDLVINEIDYDQPGTDAAEFIEIKNNSSSDANLENVTLELVNGTGGGSAIYQTITLPAETLAAGGYYVVCGDAANVANCNLDVSPDTNLVQNGAPDAVGLRFSSELLDAVSYEGDSGAPYTEGSGTGLVDDASNAGEGISRCPDGADTDQNNVDFRLTAITPGATNDCAVEAAELVINEIDYDQPSTDAAEFIEIRNNSDSTVDLALYSLELVNGTGGGASVYQTINLPVATLAAGDYFVVCGDATNVLNCDLDITPDTNLIQNGAPDAVALVFDGTIIDTVSYEGDTGAPYTEGSGSGLEDDPGIDHAGISRYPDGIDTNQNNVDLSLRCATPGEANSGDSSNCAPIVEMCGDPVTHFIHEIQGSGLASPLVGTEVAIEAIVVGDFQNNAQPDNGNLNGFHVQEEDAEVDGDPATSDGIFVFAPGSIDVSVGDHVRVRGTVTEFNGLTEIGSVSLVLQCSTDNPLPAATEVELPVTSLDDFERFEGMLVTFPQELVIAEYFNFDRFNEIVLALPLGTQDRPHQPTAIAEPGPAAAAVAEANALSRITLDDGRTTQNSDPAIHPNGAVFDLNNRFRGGDTVESVTGVLDYGFGLYRIHPTEGAKYKSKNPRPGLPDVDGQLGIASFNVLNYFLTLDTGPDICGPLQNQECRGADTTEEFNRQRAKILSALEAINADVFGLIEMENTTGVEPLQDIVDGLNAQLGAGTYDFIDTGTIGTDAIRVGLIYKPATVTPVGDYAILDSSVDQRFDDDRNRPVLAQTFMENASGGIVTVAVNHLKSKGSPCGAGDDDVQQGNCNLTRTEAAKALVDWLATDPTGSNDPDFLIMGDLNAYDLEDPIDAVRAGADDTLGTDDDYTDLILEYDDEEAYSFVFDGQLGYLDHALAVESLVRQVADVLVWHINADEPDILDYDTSFKQPAQEALYEPNAYRSSDHDPVIVGLDLGG